MANSHIKIDVYEKAIANLHSVAALFERHHMHVEALRIDTIIATFSNSIQNEMLKLGEQ
jgi:hypothetical protein